MRPFSVRSTNRPLSDLTSRSKRSLLDKSLQLTGKLKRRGFIHKLKMLDFEVDNPYSEENIRALMQVLADPNSTLENLLECEYASLLAQNYTKELKDL